MEEEYQESQWIFGNFRKFHNDLLVTFLGSNRGDIGIYKAQD